MGEVKMSISRDLPPNLDAVVLKLPFIHGDISGASRPELTSHLA